MKAIERAGARLCYHDTGETDGPVLLLLHGLGADHEMWRPQIDRYPEEGHRLLVPDLRGHGESSRADHPRLRDWVEDVLAIVEAEGVARYGLLGVSMGGIIAQGVAIADARRLGALVLCDTFMELETPGERLLGWAILQSLRAFRVLGRRRFAEVTASAYPDGSAAQEYFRRMGRAADMKQIIGARKAVNRVRHGAPLRRVTTPTLHLVGDQAGPYFVDLNRKVSDAMPKSRLEILPGGMDPSNLVVPDAFDARVLPFLAENLAGA
jgi:3-oxoadipate enol-lactonase